MKTGYAYMMLQSYSLSVDTFLAVSGIVCCISFLRTANRNKGFNWFKYTLHRYARTTPALVFVTIYGATWFFMSASGIDSHALGAHASFSWFEIYWWTSFLHISNYFGNLQHMIPHTWYLSVDMQLYVLAPIVLYPLWRWPAAGKALLAGVTLGSCLIPGILSLVYKSQTENGLPGGPFYIQRMLSFGSFSICASYFVGIMAGYFLHQLKYGGLKFQFTRLQALLLWLLSAAVALAVVFAPHSIQLDGDLHPYNAVESFFYLAFTRMSWGVAIALVIIACETGWGGPVNKILSLSAFTSLAKLCLSMYLVHFFVVLTDMYFIVHTLEYFSVYQLIRKTLSSVTLSLPLAACLHLSVEQPFMLLEQELWR